MNEDKNPANEQAVAVLPRDYKPMSSAQMKLEVPQKDGYHRHWFRGEPNRIYRAQQAGYRFVDPKEIDINNFDLGGDAKSSGNTDMGSRVSLITGDGLDNTGQPSRLYLMECPLELYEKSMSHIADLNEGVAAAVRGGQIGAEQDESAADTKTRYVKDVPTLFDPRPNKRRS